MRVTERLDISLITILLLSLALLNGCSEKAVFRYSGLVADSIFVADSLAVTESAWANLGRAASGMWKSERMVACNWHGYRSRCFLGFNLPDTTLELKSADLYLYATRIEGDVQSTTFELYTLLDTLKAGDVYWGQMPAENEIVGEFVLPAPGEDSVFVDITTVVADWLSGESDNYGFMMKLREEGAATEVVAEFGTAQSRKRSVVGEDDTTLVDVKPSLRITYIDTGGADTTLWYLPNRDTFSDTLVTPFEGSLLLVGNGFPSRSFVRYDLDGIPEGSTLTRAVLELVVAAESSSFDEIAVTCHASLDAEWSGFETDIGASGAGRVALLREDFEIDGIVRMDITALVEPQVADVAANYGLVLKSTSEAYDLDYIRFYADPKLKVFYVLPPDPWYRSD